jgi:hypothetical protein
MKKLPTVRNFEVRLAKLSKLSAAELAKFEGAVCVASSQLCGLFIETGRGHWRPNDEIKAAAAAGDAMAMTWRALENARFEIVSEKNHRLRMHGSLRPWLS